MKIYLDVGNTRIKWRCDGTSKTYIAASLDELARQWQNFGETAQVRLFGCNVRGEAIAAQISALSEACFSSPIVWLTSQSECCGVISGYQDPRRLGVDRWAALVAARARIPDAGCIVIDAGTAITVDAIDAAGRHRGGVILPGLRMMFEGLGAAQQLHTVSNEEMQLFSSRPKVLADSTRDAIIAGVIFSAQGGVKSVIEQQCEQIKAKIRSIPILVTGGDASMLKIDSLQMQWQPDIVIEGVALLSRDGA